MIRYHQNADIPHLYQTQSSASSLRQLSEKRGPEANVTNAAVPSAKGGKAMGYKYKYKYKPERPRIKYVKVEYERKGETQREILEKKREDGKLKNDETLKKMGEPEAAAAQKAKVNAQIPPQIIIEGGKIKKRLEAGKILLPEKIPVVPLLTLYEIDVDNKRLILQDPATSLNYILLPNEANLLRGTNLDIEKLYQGGHLSKGMSKAYGNTKKLYRDLLRNILIKTYQVAPKLPLYLMK